MINKSEYLLDDKLRPFFIKALDRSFCLSMHEKVCDCTKSGYDAAYCEPSPGERPPAPPAQRLRSYNHIGDIKLHNDPMKLQHQLLMRLPPLNNKTSGGLQPQQNMREAAFQEDDDENWALKAPTLLLRRLQILFCNLGQQRREWETLVHL